jgi:uncharacterized zinc-type alcohol dehydrogenase-like protein
VVTKAYGAYAAERALEPMDIERRLTGPYDVQIEIAYCGVCHSDLHAVRSEWAETLYPCVPGRSRLGSARPSRARRMTTPRCPVTANLRKGRQ